MPCSINKSHKSHMSPSFPSNLRSYWLTSLTYHLHRLHHSGQATFIHIEDSIGCEVVPTDSLRISLEEDFNVYTVKGHCSGNRHPLRSLQCKVWMTRHVRVIPITRSLTMCKPDIWNIPTATSLRIPQHKLPELWYRKAIKHLSNSNCIFFDVFLLLVSKHPVDIFLHRDKRPPITHLL